MTDRIAIVSPPTTSRLDGDAKPPSSDGATRVRPSDVSVVELSKEKPPTLRCVPTGPPRSIGRERRRVVGDVLER